MKKRSETIQLGITTRSRKRKMKVILNDNDSEFECDTKNKVPLLHFKKNWLQRYLNEIEIKKK